MFCARMPESSVVATALVMDTNFNGMVYAVQACLMELERSRHPRIIVTCSVARGRLWAIRAGLTTVRARLPT